MSRFLANACDLLMRPTAPYRERWVTAELDRQISAIPGATVKVDRFGNRRVGLVKGNPTFPPVALVAHLDHPGFVVRQVDPGGRIVHAAFEGGVGDPFFLGSPVRLFRSHEDPGVAARVQQASVKSLGPLGHRTITLEAEDDASGSVLGMWDLPPYSVKDGVLHSRACDDLIGVSMIMESLRRAAESDSPANMIGLFTRAEETGFRGTLCLAASPDAREYLPGDAWVISVETSSARPQTPVGEGAVIRVGDKSSVFDPAVTAALVDSAAELSRRGGHRPVKRALMDGGSCEATAFVLHGWRSGGVCVPLGNYHNMNAQTMRIDSEFVSLADCEDLIATMAFLGQGGLGESTSMQRLKQDLDELGTAAASILRESAVPFGTG